MIHDHRDQFDTGLMCGLLGVSRRGYYDWIDRPAPPAAVRREAIVDAIRQSHADSRCRYGSPNIHKDLLEQGLGCCVNTIA